MNCRFCQNEMLKEQVFASLNKYHPNSGHWNCENCKEKYKLHMVSYVNSIDDGEPLYVHIYSPDANFQVIQLSGTGRLPGGGIHVEVGHMYHVRLHLRDNFTYIGECNDYSLTEIMRIPGFPITPANVKDKLKLYLLLS